ncbi:hypothetical protein Tco_1127045 [Tanacetum coccineum]
MFIPNNSTVPKLQTAEDLQGDALLHYDTEMELMNLILLSIPNDIYNSVDACTSAKDKWKRVERLMRGTIQNKVDRETRFTNEFDQFVAEPGKALVSIYNCFAQLMNDLERNDMHFPIVTINTKFLNSLQPEWLKYVTQVRLAKRLTVDIKSHDPLALVAHTGSSSRKTSSYYVTHLTSVVDYEDEYQQDDVHTNGEIIEGLNAPNENGNVQRTLRTSSSGNTSTVQWMKLEIQPADNTSEVGPSYDSAFISEVQSSSNNENEEQMYPTHTKIINSTIGDDQIDSDIIFDSPNRNVNSGSIEKDTHVPDLCALEQLARNAYQEAEKQQIFAQKVQK